MLVLAVLALPGLLAAQGTTGVVRGQVFGPAGEVVESAEVSIDGLNLTTTTDGEGFYRLSDVPAGTRNLTCTYMGLQAATVEVEVVAGQTIVHDFNLTFGGELEVRGAPLLVGQAKALNRQKNALNISNIVASDQIGRFPDQNAAESTQRIPGISLLRDQGEGRYVLVRGTEARLNSTSINGERIPSPESGTRDIALDTIPSDLLESIEVSKALTPDMDGDAIGGTRQPRHGARTRAASGVRRPRRRLPRARRGHRLQCQLHVRPALRGQEVGPAAVGQRDSTTARAPTTSSPSTTTASSPSSTCGTTPSNASATASPATSTTAPRTPRATSRAACGPTTSTPRTDAPRATSSRTARSSGRCEAGSRSPSSTR